MKDMNQLRDLLKHEIQDLCSAEEQIISALPKMFEKANDPKLKQALSDHLAVTEVHRDRLDQVLNLLTEREDEDEDEKGIMGLFRGEGKQTCKGMKGLIEEGEKILKEDMTSDVMDAAIIASAQKVEHYEICAYGTTAAFAEELGLTKVEKLLRQTLDEEYEADDLLTDMAVRRLNPQAVNSRSRRTTSKNSSGSKRSSSGPKAESRTSSRSSARATASPAKSTKSKSTQSPRKKSKSSSR